MRVLAIIQLLMAWAFVQCIAAPHLLTLLNSGIPSVHDLKNRDVSLGMILGSKQLLRRGATPVAQTANPEPFAIVTSSYDASSSVSIEQIESSEGVPFRRDLNSVVAQNMPTLMETQTNSGIPGSEAFAEAVRQGIANGKRGLIGLFTRGLFTRDSKLSDTTACGGRVSCFEVHGISTQGSQIGSLPDCGGRVSCFKKRVVEGLGLTTRESQINARPDCGGRLSCFKKRMVDGLGLTTRDSQSGARPDCGGRVSCFKKRMVDGLGLTTRDSQSGARPDCGGRVSCFKKRVVDGLGLTTRDSQSGARPDCGGRVSCFKKRALDNVINNSASLTPREPIAHGPIHGPCDGGLCYIDEDNVEKRAVEDLTLKPRKPAAHGPIFWCDGVPCNPHNGKREEGTADDLTLKPRKPAAHGPIYWCDGVPCNPYNGKREEGTADDLNL